MNDMIEAKVDFESPRIQAVSLGDGEFVLNVSWENGSVSRVDLTEIVYRFTHLRPLRNSKRFETAKVGDWGWEITWGDDLDIPGEQIWKLARAQAEAMMTPGEFRAWLRRHNLTQENAAELLGVSKRTV